MLRTMYTARNTLNQVQHQLDTISNNIANVNTVGFKAKEARFSELLYQQFQNSEKENVNRLTPEGIRYGVGAKVGQIKTNQSVGSLQTTDRDLDFALINERQYFNVLMPNGENDSKIVYSRQGDFYVTPVNGGEVMLVNNEGYPVADASGNPIIFHDNVEKFSLNDQGTFVVQYAGGEQETFNLGITEIHLPQMMENVSGSYISLPDNFQQLGYSKDDLLTNLEGIGRESIGLVSGKLELSNVDLSKEMTNLIQAQRSYQFNARAVTIADQMLGLINGIR